MRKGFVTLVVIFACSAYGNAQTARDAVHLAPNGKGWGVERKASIEAGTAANKQSRPTASATTEAR